MRDALPTSIPHGRTARRLEWPHLPAHVRALVERECGSPVVRAVSQTAGFTPGFASVVTCEDGSRHFVKAASVTAQRMFADSYREEARKLAALPPETPAPRLLWAHDGTGPEGWVVLGIEYVEARAPHRPWRDDDLAACLRLTERIAETLTPAPPGLLLGTASSEFAPWPALWDSVPTTRPGLPPDQVSEAASLAAGYAAVVAGSTVVHTDVRDDNILIRTDGTALLCDWNWPVAGAAWLDTFFLLFGPRGDGLDVESVLARHRLTRDVPAEQVDVVLALVTGYFMDASDQPVPPSSPHLRDHQRWQERVCWGWLAERRGWV